MPELTDNDNVAARLAAGGKDADSRARELVRRRLAGCEPPPRDPAVEPAPDDVLARRERELPEPMA